ncbi:Y-family DNA polymerase [Pseudoalteromonas sp. T1lg23B]|uniref:Y-family DNA polymerase n=1 Tax=Pseudoalteromonas sp. T1lg23B TaxID=2077097 RepID=UPI000CF65AEB|nr:DNA polymerase Y family protein [Pseudoalteromonas sp. T1lg23B]
MTLWLYLHFKHLQLDSLTLSHKGEPVVIVNGSSNRVVQVCTLAKQSGITVGMGLASAACLSEHLQVVAYDAQAEQTRLQEIAQWLYLATADISLFPPDGILLKVSNMLSLYQDLATYWQHIQAHLSHLELNYHYATGYSALAARLLARGRVDIITDDAALLQSSINGFDLLQTDLSEQICEQLKRVRISKLSQLLCIPVSELAKRFDIELVHYVGRLQGQLKYPLIFYVPEEQFSRHLTLLFELENLQWLTKPMAKLLKQLELFLQQRNKLAQQVLLTLQLRDAEPVSIQVAISSGESRAHAWQSLIELKLSNISLNAPIQAITISADYLLDNQYANNELFQSQQGQSEIPALIAKLQAKLGGRCVQGVAVDSDHRPERAFHFVDPSHAYIKQKRITGLQRPSMLLPEVIPLQEKVTIYFGPERICTGWWDNQAVARDYYIARNEQGKWLWVYKEPSQQWFVQGIFC